MRFSFSIIYKETVRRRAIFGAIFCLSVMLCASYAAAATYQTKNFTVTAHDPQIAQKMAIRSEELRKNMAELWLGKTLPNWYKRAEIKIKIGQLSPGGQTTFIFNNGEVYDWKMEIQGTEERVFDSVLPHEITHMILASHFRQPVPRWADEGAATFTESLVERQQYQQKLLRYLKGQKGIPLDRLFAMEEYPAKDPMPLYAQGYSVTEFLIRQRGTKYFIYFVDRSMKRKCRWADLVHECYGYETLQELQTDWVEWVANGCPEFLGSKLVAGDQMHENLPDENLQIAQDAPDAVHADSRVIPAVATGAAPPAGASYPEHEAVHWKSTDFHPE